MSAKPSSTSSVTDALAALEVRGTFATRLRAPAEDLDVQVTGVGRLDFPITPALARKLRDVARPAPFGLREQTLHDPRVRSTWEVAASRVKIAARRWKPALAMHLRAIQAALGLPEECALEAVFDKLLVYEEGQFFKPHQDSEKRDGMVATLVVVLPSEYGGGALTVEQRGEKKTFRRVESQSEELSLLAFYADCHHTVSPIRQGVRVALTYQLVLGGRPSEWRPKARAEGIDDLTESVRAHFAVPVAKRYERSAPVPPERLVYLLDHEYTQRSLAWAHLKNGDRVRVAALRAAADRLDCECFLALAEVHETWSCEDDDRYGRYGRRRPRVEDEGEGGAGEHALVDLQDSEVRLDHWVGVTGDTMDGIPGGVGDHELHFTKPSRELDPFKSEHEGYQGNYGNTVDRWYHRAALVMWPRRNTFALKAQASPQGAVKELLALPRSATIELEAKITTLLPRWSRTARGVDDARFFAELLKLATRIDDGALALGWLAPLGVERLRSRTMRADLAMSIDKHGLPWAKKLFEEWTKNQRWGTPAWMPRLADLCEELCARKSAACEALAKWLIEREAKAACERCVTALKGLRPWLDLQVFTEEAAHVAHVLAAAVAVSELRALEETTRFLLDEPRSFPVAFFAQLLAACVARSPALRDHVAGSGIRRVCEGRIEAVLSAPERADDDWTIEYPLSCACVDCKELSQFLRSTRTAHDWPLSQARRQHIHGTLDAAKLPVLHETLRRGSPYVLQLRKDRTLFSRERAYRARLREVHVAAGRSAAGDA